MKDIKIRNVLPDDVATCHGIETACFEPSEAATEDKIRKRQQLFPEGFLVAEMNRKVVGFINSGATDKPDLSDEAFKDLIGHDSAGRHMVILSLAVHPVYQGAGMSRVLLEAFIERSTSMGKKTILLLCKENLLAYYAKFGFENLGVSASDHGGFRWHEMRVMVG